MTAEDITASVIHKYNNVDTLFLYLSTTEKIIQSDIKKGKSNDHDYTHMISKYSISNVLLSQEEKNQIRPLVLHVREKNYLWGSRTLPTQVLGLNS